MKQQNDVEIIRFNTDLTTGLTTEQVESNTLKGLVNKQKNTTSKSYSKIIFGNIFTFFNILTFTIGAVIIAVGKYSDALFLTIILANLAIGITQEISAKRTIEKLSLLSVPIATVIRNGETKDISISEVVLDDLLVYETGDQISSDAIIKEGSIEVNESLLTGESFPIKKKVGDFIYAGSFVSSGFAKCKVEHIGKDNYIETLSMQAKKFKVVPSELLKSLRLIIKIIGFMILPIGALMFYNNFVNSGGSFTDATVQTAGTIIGMIPAGMFLLTSVALAVGVVRLSKYNTLVKDLYCIEMLARTNVLCLDKTGTITDGTMEVKAIKSYTNKFKIEDIVTSMLNAMPTNNVTGEALLKYFNSDKKLNVVTVVPFSSERKKSAVSIDKLGTFVLGASEFICKNLQTNVANDIDELLKKGLRVLMIAHSDSFINDDIIPSDVTPMFIVALSDHIRDTAIDTINWFKQNDVDIKIISGDNPIAVSEIAKAVKINNADKFINLEGLTEQQVRAAANTYTVFGRVSPEQKFFLVSEMHKAGKTVSMTGDGVNDILAFKEADCSIAMASGSEAAKNVANLVLLDSNFASMPEVVLEGRRVINNIQKSSSLFLMKTFFTIVFSLFIAILGEPYPITPSKLMLFEFCVIGIPSVLLVIQPNKNIIKGRFLTTVLSKAAPYALVFIINAVSIYTFAPIFKLDAYFDAMTIYTMTYIGFIALLFLSLPLNKYRFCMVLGSVVVITLGFLILPKIRLADSPILDIERIPMEAAIMCLINIILSIPLFVGFIKLFEKVFKDKLEIKTGLK